LNQQELEQRLENVVNNIRTSETELKKLREDKKQRILLLRPADLKSMSSRIRELEEQVEDSKLAREALEKEIQEVKEKEPEALKIGKRLAKELWPAALAEYDKLKRIHEELRSVLEKITGLNNEMMNLAIQHKRLIGDKILTPQIPVPPELYSVADAKFDAAPPKLDLRVGTQREQDRLADQLKQQRPTVSKILKHINIAWPLCPTCGAELLAQRYAMAEDGSTGHASLRCSKHPDQWMEVSFPARAPPPGARWPIPSEDPVPIGDVAGSVPSTIQSHRLAQPGLTDQNTGGEKTT